jgi:hypothetical protein
MSGFFDIEGLRQHVELQVQELREVGTAAGLAKALASQAPALPAVYLYVRADRSRVQRGSAGASRRTETTIAAAIVLHDLRPARRGAGEPDELKRLRDTVAAAIESYPVTGGPLMHETGQITETGDDQITVWEDTYAFGFQGPTRYGT